MQQHEYNKHNYLRINDSLNFLFPCENQGVTMARIPNKLFTFLQQIVDGLVNLGEI
jgi:hypothetical protein